MRQNLYLPQAASDGAKNEAAPRCRKLEWKAAAAAEERDGPGRAPCTLDGKQQQGSMTQEPSRRDDCFASSLRQERLTQRLGKEC